MFYWYIHHIMVYRTVWYLTCAMIHSKKKTDIVKSHYHTNGARVWGFFASQDLWMQIFREWRVTRALCIIHLSHFRSALSFFFQSYRQPFSPPLFSSSRYLARLRGGSNFNSGRYSYMHYSFWRLLLNKRNSLRTSRHRRFMLSPSVNLRRTPYYKLFRAAQFKSIAANFALLRTFLLSLHFESSTSVTGGSIVEVRLIVSHRGRW